MRKPRTRLRAGISRIDAWNVDGANGIFIGGNLVVFIHPAVLLDVGSMYTTWNSKQNIGSKIKNSHFSTGLMSFTVYFN